VPVTISDTGGSTAGRIQPGDTLVVVFSEALNPATVSSSSTVRLTDPSGAGNDTLSVTGIGNGELNTGSDGYITADNSAAAYAGSALTLSNANKTVTATVGPTCSGGGCGNKRGTVTSNPSLVFVPSPALTDAAGNAATGALTVSISLF
jgi:hypothetical protein